MPVSAEGRVEHQKLNQTAALLSFGWVFGLQLDSQVNKSPLWWSISCNRRWSGPRRCDLCTRWFRPTERSGFTDMSKNYGIHLWMKVGKMVSSVCGRCCGTIWGSIVEGDGKNKSWPKLSMCFKVLYLVALRKKSHWTFFLKILLIFLFYTILRARRVTLFK